MRTQIPPINNILIIGPAWVGDMVMAQTLFMLLKAHNPTVNIDVLAPEWSHGLLERMPEVRRAWTSPFQHKELNLRGRYQLGKLLKKEGYQQAIVLPNSLKSALVPFWANIPLRTGWIKEPRWILLNDSRYAQKKLPLMIERFMALGLAKDQELPKPLPHPNLFVKEESITAALEKLGLDRSKGPILALCPGAEFGPSKRWPPHYYAEVAKQKMAEGWQVWLFGSPKDSETAAEIQKICQADEQHSKASCMDLTGKTRLVEAIDLLSLANLVISNDSGLMHIAAALDKPLIVIYGSSSPKFTPPLSSKAKIVSLGIECSPCFQKNCPLGHFKCMLDLKPSIVMKALAE